MAEINVASKSGRRSSAIRIDLTPMVDLGFLLITFFMFTTTMARQKTIELNMPDNEPTEHPTAFAAESTITIIAADKHTFYYYSGVPNDIHTIPHAHINDMREVIIKNKQAAVTLPAILKTK